jgi:hypothetical protein
MSRITDILNDRDSILNSQHPGKCENEVYYCNRTPSTPRTIFKTERHHPTAYTKDGSRVIPTMHRRFLLTAMNTLSM